MSNLIMKCAGRLPSFSVREAGGRPSARRKARRAPMTCECLENRTVLSPMGFGGPMEGMGMRGMRMGGMGMGGRGAAEMNFAGASATARAAGPSDSLIGGLEQLGILGPSGKDMGSGGSWGGLGPGSDSQSSSSSQLQTDQAKLKTDLQAIAANSGVTVADLNNLANDEQALRTAGAQPNASSLQSALSALATAVASGADPTQAKATLSTALAGSASVPQATLTTAVNDVVQAIQDSHVTTTNLTTIASDRAAIQSDLGITPGGAAGARTTLVGDLANLGVLGSYGLAGSGGPLMFAGRGDRAGWRSNQGSQNTQLQTDQAKLQTDLQAIAANSGVTVADLNNLTNDDQAIAGATTPPDATKLQAGLSELATAVAAGSDTTQAVADINAAFANTGLSATVINKAISDVTQVIQDSHITSAQLTTIAADHTAIQNDQASSSSSSSSSTTATSTTTVNAAATTATTTTTSTTAATTPSSTTTTASHATGTKAGHGHAAVRAREARGRGHRG